MRARHNRIAPVYSGQHSWRTRLRRAWRRVWPRLPKSDEEVLLAMRLAMEFGHVDWLRMPMDGLRLLRPLPETMLAADGKTSFRYFKVQKAACSSIVHMLVKSCARSDDFAGGTAKWRSYRRRYVQNDDPTRVAVVAGEGWHGPPFFYRYKPFAAKPHADIRFCVVRDPVERFQAAFDDIVTRRKFYTDGSIPVEDFLCRIEETWAEAERDKKEYRVGAFASDMHFRPQHFSLGEDASYFTHIFNLRQLPQLRDLLSELAGAEIPLIHANARVEQQKTELTAAQKKRVAALYARDYEIFGRYF